MVFIGSIIGVFILSNLVPKSLIYSLHNENTTNQIIQSNENSSQSTIEDTTTTFPNGIIDTMRTIIEIDDPHTQSPVQKNLSKKPFGFNSPVFIDGKITPTGEFTNYRGTVFVAGILSYSGTYPQDFEQLSSQESEVSIELAFGWKKLPSFAEIKNKNKNENKAQLYLPELSILDLKIRIKNSSYKVLSKEITTQVSQYLYTLFAQQLIPSRIVHLAQQRLAAAYIAKNKMSIKLIPY